MYAVLKLNFEAVYKLSQKCLQCLLILETCTRHLVVYLYALLTGCQVLLWNIPIKSHLKSVRTTLY